MTSSRLSRIAVAVPPPRMSCDSRRISDGVLSSSFDVASAIGASRSLARIGIADPEFAQDFHLKWLHDLCRLCGLVIVAEQMKHPVHCQMGRMVGKRLLLLARFLACHPIGDRDIAKIVLPLGGKRQ